MAHFAVVKLSFIMGDTGFGLLYFPCEINCNVFYKRGKMAIIISDERDLGSGIVEVAIDHCEVSTISQNQSLRAIQAV